MSLNLNTTNTILIIEPDDVSRDTLTEIFKNSNFKVLIAGDGVEGLSVASNEEKLDVVLSRLKMPRIDGMEFIKRKNEDKLLSQVPVVIFDNINSEEEKQEILKAGASDFIIKGTVAPDKLVQRVSRVIQQGDYMLQIDPYALDAQKLIEDYHLNKNFKCTNCGADLAIKLTIGKDKNMKANISCPDCGKQYL